MKKSGARQGQSASELISKGIAELGDWRGETLSRMRTLVERGILARNPEGGRSTSYALARVS